MIVRLVYIFFFYFVSISVQPYINVLYAPGQRQNPGDTPRPVEPPSRQAFRLSGRRLSGQLAQGPQSMFGAGSTSTPIGNIFSGGSMGSIQNQVSNIASGAQASARNFFSTITGRRPSGISQSGQPGVSGETRPPSGRQPAARGQIGGISDAIRRRISGTPTGRQSGQTGGSGRGGLSGALSGLTGLSALSGLPGLSRLPGLSNLNNIADAMNNMPDLSGLSGVANTMSNLQNTGALDKINGWLSDTTYITQFIDSVKDFIDNMKGPVKQFMFRYLLEVINGVNEVSKLVAGLNYGLQHLSEKPKTCAQFAVITKYATIYNTKKAFKATKDTVNIPCKYMHSGATLTAKKLKDLSMLMSDGVSVVTDASPKGGKNFIDGIRVVLYFIFITVIWDGLTAIFTNPPIAIGVLAFFAICGIRYIPPIRLKPLERIKTIVAKIYSPKYPDFRYIPVEYVNTVYTVTGCKHFIKKHILSNTHIVSITGVSLIVCMSVGLVTYEWQLLRGVSREKLQHYLKTVNTEASSVGKYKTIQSRHTVYYRLLGRCSAGFSIILLIMLLVRINSLA